MLLSPSKYLSREFLRRLKESLYITETGREYSAFEVDYMLAEKESRLALAEYNAELRRLINQNNELNTEIQNSLSSNDAPKINRADTTLVLKKVSGQCFYGPTTESIGANRFDRDEKQHRAGSKKLPAQRLENKLKTPSRHRYNEREITKAQWLKEIAAIKKWRKQNRPSR